MIYLSKRWLVMVDGHELDMLVAWAGLAAETLRRTKRAPLTVEETEKALAPFRKTSAERGKN